LCGAQEVELVTVFFLYSNGISPLNDVQGGVTKLRAEIKKLGVLGLNDVFRG
jgi:hypothetical protein